MKQKPGIFTQSLGDDELIAVPTQGENVDRVLTLNGSGGFVWKLLEKERSFEELTELVVEEYGISDQQARADLTEFIEAIKEYID